MATVKEFRMSQERYDELKKELDYSKTTRADEIAELIKEARGFGDLSENSEYDEAKNEQGLIETRIMYLEKTLKNVRVLDTADLSADQVTVGCRVKLRDEDGEEEEYTIVGSTEADPTEGKISDESAVGKGLLGHKVGEVVDITVPSGAVIHYSILSIEA